jgi:hypothetical protein
MQPESKKFLVVFLIIAALVTLQVLLVGVAVQQNYRQSANDPQIAAASDVASALAQGAPVDAIAQQPIDISKSLEVFPIVYDSSGKVAASGATLGSNSNLTVPSSVLAYAKAHGSDRFTWEPQKGVRVAAVVVPYSASGTNGYVLIGRNIQQIEQRENMLTVMVLVAWIIAMLLAFALTWVLVYGVSATLFTKKNVVEEITIEEHVTVEKM